MRFWKKERQFGRASNRGRFTNFCPLPWPTQAMTRPGILLGAEFRDAQSLEALAMRDYPQLPAKAHRNEFESH